MIFWQLSGDIPLNHNKQTCKLVPNDNHVKHLGKRQNERFSRAIRFKRFLVKGAVAMPLIVAQRRTSNVTLAYIAPSHIDLTVEGLTH